MKLIKHYELWCAAGAPCHVSSCFPECHYARIIESYEGKLMKCPEECSCLDREKGVCHLNPQIVCRPDFEHFPKGCIFEEKK